MRIDVLGVGFDNLTMEEAIQRAMAMLTEDRAHYVVTPNPEIVELCRAWSEVNQAVNGADLVLPDGIGIIKGAEILGTPLKERTPGIEFAGGLMSAMAKTGHSLYLLGAKPGVAERAAERLKTQYPGLTIAGTHDGYFQSDAPVVEAVRESGADVVFVCTGAPRQELWMKQNGPATGARLLCGLGGSLDIFSGTSKRAPKFWCDHGLEWLYRLLKEPSRWKRMQKLPEFLRHVRQERHQRLVNGTYHDIIERVRAEQEQEQKTSAAMLFQEESGQQKDQQTKTLGHIPADEETEILENIPMDERSEISGNIPDDEIPEETEMSETISADEESEYRKPEETGILISAPDNEESQQQTPEETEIFHESIQKAPESNSGGQMNREDTMSDYNKETNPETEHIPPDGKADETVRWDAEDVRQREPGRKRRKKRKLWVRIPVYLIFVGILSLLLAEFGWLLFSDLCAFNRGAQTTSTIVISAGDSMSDVADKLYDAGLIRYKPFFRLFAKIAKAEEKIGEGTYELNNDMDYRALIVGMRNRSGNIATNVVRVMIPEGYTLRDIVALLVKNGVATEEELMEAARTAEFEYDFIDNTSQDPSRLEGYLFPDTYDFYQPERPASALNKLLSNFQRKMDNWQDGLAYAANRGYDLKSIVTIASLIEKETDGTDQARIASVIDNRLHGPGDRGGTYGMLQIDASLLYVLDHRAPITTEDLQLDSPYNLYRYAGLPPTPIANPGAKAIEAALAPEVTDYYYYGLAKDNKHRFFTDYREFTAFLSSSNYIGN